MGMLVLSRYKDESIMVGNSVKIVVIDIRGDRVRLGIEAPGNVAVHRQEVYDAIERQNNANKNIRNQSDGEPKVP